MMYRATIEFPSYDGMDEYLHRVGGRFVSSVTRVGANGMSPPPIPKESSLKGRHVKPRYRNPTTGETWVGRGAVPRWMRPHLETGKKKEDFLIQPSVNLATQVLRFLQTYPDEQRYAWEVVKSLKCNPNSIHSAIKALRRNGLITMPNELGAKGLYKLTSVGRNFKNIVRDSRIERNTAG